LATASTAVCTTGLHAGQLAMPQPSAALDHIPSMNNRVSIRFSFSVKQCFSRRLMRERMAAPLARNSR
jgi:hypothetical protein